MKYLLPLLLLWLILQTAMPTLPTVRVDAVNDSPGVYSALKVDREGKLISFCDKCPNKMCEHLACSGNLADGKFIWNCECVKESK